MTLSYTLEELSEVARKIINAARYKIFLFDAEMGVGKTTLIKQICKQLGVEDTISSPTYSIVNEYHGAETLIYHFDFYRIKSQEEAYDIGFEEYVDSGAWLFIEWPDKIKDLLPIDTTIIKISLKEDDKRLLVMLNS